MKSKTINGFISYAHDDYDFVKPIIKGLSSHANGSAAYLFNFWEDHQLEIGTNWYEEIVTRINACDFTILLISANFLSSEFIKKEEFNRFCERVKSEKFKIFPILLRHCKYSKWDELNKLQIFHPDGRKYFINKEKIAYSDLIKFDDNQKAIQNSGIDLYHMDLVELIETSLSKFNNTPALTKSEKAIVLKPKKIKPYFANFTDKVSIKKSKFGVYDLSITLEGDYSKITEEEKEEIIRQVENCMKMKREKNMPSFEKGSIIFKVANLNTSQIKEFQKNINKLKITRYKIKAIRIEPPKKTISDTHSITGQNSNKLAIKNKKLIIAVAQQAKISENDAKKAIESFFNVTTKALRKGDRVALIGFGTFSMAKRAARNARNRAMGKQIKISSKNTIQFKLEPDNYLINKGDD